MVIIFENFRRALGKEIIMKLEQPLLMESGGKSSALSTKPRPRFPHLPAWSRALHLRPMAEALVEERQSGNEGVDGQIKRAVRTEQSHRA